MPRGGLSTGTYRFLTGGSYISKSDRPYAHSPGAVAARAPHTALVSGLSTMIITSHTICVWRRPR
jgi:hypothetical protein